MTKKFWKKRGIFFPFFSSKQKNTYTKHPATLLLLLRAFERAFGAFLSPLRREENGEVSGDDEETTE
jgi:DNA replication protein DnaD